MSVANASLMPHSTPTRAMILVQRVRQRQEHEADLVGFEHRSHRVEVLQHVRSQVAVRDRTALGPSGRARRVDDRGQPIGRERGDALVQHRVVDAVAAARQLVEAAFVDHERRARRQACRAAMPAYICGHLRRLEDDGDGLAVAEDPLQLLGRRGLVDGDGHPAGGEDGVVDEQPLEARV